MIKNIYQLLWDKNQKHKAQYNMRCSVFSAMHNAYYNTWIDSEYEDIDRVWKQAKLLKMLDDNAGGRTQVFEIFYLDFEAKTIWMMPKHKKVSWKYWDKQMMDLLKLWYAIRVWFWVNKEFFPDRLDKEIDTYKDYNKYKGSSFKHFFNIAIDSEIWQKDKEIAIDSFAPNRYGININEFKKIAYPTRYAIIPE